MAGSRLLFIIDLPRPELRTQPQMSRRDLAVQLVPYASLTKHGQKTDRLSVL